MKLIDADAIVRSKNAGPFRITIDVIFKDEGQFKRMRESGVWESQKLAQLYKLKKDMILECLVYEPALSFKCTYKRDIASGSFGDTDIYGAQQHIPLYDLEI